MIEHVAADGILYWTFLSFDTNLGGCFSLAESGCINVFGTGCWWLRIPARLELFFILIFCSNLYDYGFINRENYHFLELERQGMSFHLIPVALTIIIPVVVQDENTRNFFWRLINVPIKMKRQVLGYRIGLLILCLSDVKDQGCWV